MVCILSTYFFGLALGGGHVVYAAWKKPDRRWAYLCQVGVGLPALPALVQSRRVRVEGKPPLWNEFMAPPKALPGKTENTHDKTSDWHLQYGTLFDIGTLYTMIAGLLNVLAVYDAFAGPVGMEPGRSTDKPPPKK